MNKTTQKSGLSDYELELDRLADKIKATKSSLECIKILRKFKNQIMFEKVQARKINSNEWIEGSLLYDSDHACWRIVTDFFDVEKPKLDDQFGVTAYEIDPKTVIVISP